MNRLLSHSLVKLLAGCAVLLLVDCFASRAWAGCGDHAMSDKERADASRSTKDMPSHVPCTGPMCSRNNEVPPVTPAPVQSQDDCGLPPERCTPTANPLAGMLASLSLLPVSIPAGSIFHPPRVR